MEDCDTLVLLGTNYPYGQFLPETGQARAVQIDLKPEQMGLRYPTEVNLWGDVKTTLAGLIPLLKQKEDRSWQEKVADEMREWDEEMAAQAERTLRRRRQPATRVPRAQQAASGGRDRHRRRRHHAPTGTATTSGCTTGCSATCRGGSRRMLAAMPYADAAKFAYSDRTVVCTIGDGAFQMLGMNELITIKKYL